MYGIEYTTGDALILIAQELLRVSAPWLAAAAVTMLVILLSGRQLGAMN